MKLAFYTAIIGMTLLFITLYKMEMTGKHNRAQLKALRRRLTGDGPATGRPQRRAPGGRVVSTDTLPDNAGYVAAAYLVFVALLLIYLAITAIRSSRLERELRRAH